MKKLLFALFALFAISLPAANLLPAEMSWETWRCWIAPQYKVATPRREWFTENALKLDIPLQKSKSSAILLYHLVPLEDGQDYRLTFEIKSDRPAELTVGAGIRQKPHYPLFTSKKLQIHPGDLQYDWSFRFIRKRNFPENAPSALSFQLGNFIDSKIEIRNVKLEKVEPCPELNDEWTAFVNATVYRDAPAGIPKKWTYSANGRQESDVFPIKVKAVNGKIDCLPLMPKHEPRSCVMLMNEIQSDRDRTVRLGLSADWYFTFSCNGKEYYSTSRHANAGNHSYRFTPDDHPVDFELKKGKNTIAIKVFPGTRGWFLKYGATSKTPRNQMWQNLASWYLPTFAVRDDSKGWKTAALGKLVVQSGTALDFSASVDVPAGKYGRLILNEKGEPVFERARKTPVRFFGANEPFPLGGLYPYENNVRDSDGVVNKELVPMNRAEFEMFAKEYARALRALGMNHIRYHIESRCWYGSKEERERNWFMISELKKQGCYLNISIYDHRGSVFSDSLPRRIGLLLLTDEAKARFRENAKTILNTVNPYTGTRLADDPQLVTVEFSNEEEACMIWTKLKGTRVTKKEYELFDLRFREFLTKKYKDIAALNKAWNTSFVSFREIRVPYGLLSGAAKDSPKSRDFIECCTELQNRMMEFCEKTVREFGYKGLIGQFDVPVWFGDNAVRSRYSQVALGHSYWSHAITLDFKSQRDAVRGQRAATMQSAIGSAILYWRNLATAKFADRPYFVTETNHCPPNPYSYEFGLVMGGYSAFQNFHAVLPHSSPVYQTPRRIDAFSLGSNPVGRGSLSLIHALFQRGDVSASSRNIALQVSPELTKFFQPTSPEQTKLALMTGFSIEFPGMPRPAGVRKTVPHDLAVQATRTNGLYKPELDDAVGAGSGKDRVFNAEEFTGILRRHGILPASNLSDPERGIYQTDNGQLTMFTAENKLEVRTPRTQGACLTTGGSADLGDFSIESTNTNGCIALVSLDKHPLSDSSRMLLIFTTSAANRNGKISYDGAFLHGWNNGEPIPMLRTGKFHASLKQKRPAEYKLYALALDGTRREEIPLEKENGNLKITVDTDKLKEASVYFELIRI